MCVCVYVCVCIYTCITHTHTHTHTQYFSPLDHLGKRRDRDTRPVFFSFFLKTMSFIVAWCSEASTYICTDMHRYVSICTDIRMQILCEASWLLLCSKIPARGLLRFFSLFLFVYQELKLGCGVNIYTYIISCVG